MNDRRFPTNGSSIIPAPNPRGLSLSKTSAITKRGSESSNVDITKAKAWLEKKENYEVGFKQAKKKCFMSVDKSNLATILELSNTKEMFEALDKKYSATKAACPRQLLRNCQAISTQKSVTVMKKYEAMLNLNVEIGIQKPEFTFPDEHLINFLLARMPPTYEGIIYNLKMRNTLTLNGAVRALCKKETELTNLGIIKEESAHFTTQGRFRRGRRPQGGTGTRKISRTHDGGYAIQGYSQCGQ